MDGPVKNDDTRRSELDAVELLAVLANAVSGEDVSPDDQRRLAAVVGRQRSKIPLMLSALASERMSQHANIRRALNRCVDKMTSSEHFDRIGDDPKELRKLAEFLKRWDDDSIAFYQKVMGVLGVDNTGFDAEAEVLRLFSAERPEENPFAKWSPKEREDVRRLFESLLDAARGKKPPEPPKVPSRILQGPSKSEEGET